MSEQRESAVIPDILSSERLVCHREHQYTLDKHYHLPYSAGHQGKDDGQDTCDGLPHIEIVYTETAEKNSQQSGAKLPSTWISVSRRSGDTGAPQ